MFNMQVIIGYIDSFDIVHSKRVDSGKSLMHGDLFKNSFHERRKFRYMDDKYMGYFCRTLNTNDFLLVDEHLYQKYNITVQQPLITSINR